MRTKTTTKARTVETTTIEIAFAAKRLAYQLGTTPEKIIKHALRIGLRNIDWNLSEDCRPFADGCHFEEFNITEAMNRLSPQRFAALCDGDETPQKVLADANRHRMHAKWKKENGCAQATA